MLIQLRQFVLEVQFEQPWGHGKHNFCSWLRYVPIGQFKKQAPSYQEYPALQLEHIIYEVVPFVKLVKYWFFWH